MLTEKAQKIFESKYARDIGDRKETWAEATWRVAYYVAQAELEHGGSNEDVLKWAVEFSRIMLNNYFIPGGRILANAGTDIKNMFNCFVLPIEDSREGIYEALGVSAEIFNQGGGVGYNFSSVRERGAEISGTGGSASGPLSFMDLFDHTGEVISQASRRGAQAGILNVDHPDIEAFIDFKATPNKKNARYISEVERQMLDFGFNEADTEQAVFLVKDVLTDNQLTHFNISVGISDAFMDAVVTDSDWQLVGRVDGKVKKTLKARDLMKQIAESAWRSGDPGVIFLDRTEEGNMVPYLGKLEATNPCFEIAALPYEPCCLGSLNLAAMVFDGELSEELLSYVTTIAVRFLDNVHTMNEIPVKKVDMAGKSTRRLGLGVMGWADTLIKTRLPYDSEEALEFAELIMKTISAVAWGTSEHLAEERGVFPAFNDKVINTISYHYRELPPMRNVAVTAIAPTGTIALLAGVNSSIEPFFALSYKRNITDGIGSKVVDTHYEFNPYLEEYFGNNEEIKKLVGETGLLPNQHPDITEEDAAIFKTAGEIHWMNHIKMQAAFQKYTDNAISKTINMPEDSTIEDVMKAYIYAWESKLKSVAIYRDNSKVFQILNK